MRLPVRFFLIPALALSCASAGLWLAQGQRSGRSNYVAEARSAGNARYGNVTFHVANDAFVLKNVKLAQVGSSTIVKGEVVNRSNRYLDQATFEVKAYDLGGNLLRGAERDTIFTVNRLRARGSARINSGYGVWLQGIPPDRIARVEISETGNEMNASSALKLIPFASHALTWKMYSEIEE